MSENEKPRICEVLGVEIGEEWEYPLDGQTKRFRLTALPGNIITLETINDNDINGRWEDASVMFYSRVFIKIFTHPEEIIHKKKSHWTAEDIADAKAVRQLWPRAWSVKHGREYMIIYNSAGVDIEYLGKKTFPSIQLGESVDLDVILEAENGQGKEAGQAGAESVSCPGGRHELRAMGSRRGNHPDGRAGEKESER